MLAFLSLFIIIVLWGIRVKPHGMNDDFLSKTKTDAVKGIFIMIVFMNHINDYYSQVGTDLSAWYDNVFFLPAKACGQLMVAMFLFYSGYGVMEGIKKKGQVYVDSIPKKRMLGTLLNFDLAVLAFAVATLLMGLPLTWETILLSLLGWDSLGNSNWYIFVIVVCYALTYVGQKIKKSMGGAITCALIMLFAFVLSFEKGTWWYNTVFAYGAGLMFSEHKELLLVSMKSHYGKWIAGMVCGFAMCLGTYLSFYGPFKGEHEQLGAFVFDVMSVFFALLMVLITMKVSIGNKALVWLGTNLFPVYIYQRLPMMVLTELWPDELVALHPYAFFSFCVVITGWIAYCYKWVNVRI